MDGLNLAAAVAEAQSLTGGRIDKIQQPDRDELVILIRSGGENRRLLISASPENCRLHLTNSRRENPMEAPAFCMLLRKRLIGGRVISIEQPNLDRVVNMTIEAQNDFGDPAPYTLCAEIMGKYSNIILINENNIIADAIKRVGIGMSKVRTVLPGQRYSPPPSQDKMNPLEAELGDFSAALMSPLRADKALCEAFFGLSPATAEMLSGEKRPCGSLTEGERTSVAVKLCGFYQKLGTGVFTPVMTLDEAGRPDGVLPFIPAGREYEEMPSIWEAMDRLYAAKDVAQRMKRQGAGIRRALQNNIGRCNKKLAMYDEAVNTGGDAEKLRLYGELLTANARALARGAEEAAVVNYYADPPEKLIIPVDPCLTPNANAQKYYKKYKKAKAAGDMAAKRRESVLGEIEYLEGQLDNLDKCTGGAELNELYEELVSEGYMKRPKRGEKVRKLPPSRPVRFVSSDGIDIYVGKNNRQNDMLTLKLAEPDDIWMHVKDMPGSHVIVKSPDPPRATLYEAALLAAYYSRGKNGSNVPVDYTGRKHVKKPSGAKPGMVVYTANRTVYVTPCEEEIGKIAKPGDSR